MSGASPWHPPVALHEQRPDLSFREPRIIDAAMAYHTGPRRLVIQAGGHLGIWPAKLSTLFAQVVSFEPVPDLWEICMASIQASNVLMLHGCLGRAPGMACVSALDKRYSGSAHVTKKAPAFPSPVYSVDTLPVWIREQVDAVFLDVEGYELEGLHGMRETLRQMHPLVVVEENNCGLVFGVQPGDIGRWLAPLGYREYARVDRDVVYGCAP